MMESLENDPRLKWIAKEWEDGSDDLANWALQNIVNRFDVWGQYTVKNDALGKSIGVVTLPVKELRGKGDMVSFDKLKRHFRGRKPSDLIGLHSVSKEKTCRWFAIDLDVHDEKDSSYFSKNNFEAMRLWAESFRSQLLDPCILDSNGIGAYHLLVLLDKPHPLDEVFNFLSNACKNHHNLDLPNKPELFPSSQKLKALGKWLRMPGRHHSRSHFTKVWSDDFGGQWLEGTEAIEAIINLAPTPLPKTQSVTAEKPAKEIYISTSHARTHSIAVDLDGVLAKYDGWKDIEHIGSPISGAREFLAEISRKYRVIIHTARFSNARVKDSHERERLRNLIEIWLRQNKMDFDEVFVGVGKPLASAFVDDRAVECRPQEDSEAFNQALYRIDKIVA